MIFDTDTMKTPGDNQDHFNLDIETKLRPNLWFFHEASQRSKKLTPEVFPKNNVRHPSWEELLT